MKRTVPTWKEKQSLLYDPDSKPDPEKLTQIGLRALEVGEVHEALEYFGYAGNVDELKKVETLAKEEGDTFLLFSLEHFLDEEYPKEDWNHVGQTALDRGKKRFALMAFKRAENEVMVAKLKETEDRVDLDDTEAN